MDSLFNKMSILNVVLLNYEKKRTFSCSDAKLL